MSVCSSTDHRPLSSSSTAAPPHSSSFPLFTPAAVPASYLSSMCASVSDPFHGLSSHAGLFASPSLMPSALMVGLSSQFNSRDALLGTSK